MTVCAQSWLYDEHLAALVKEEKNNG